MKFKLVRKLKPEASKWQFLVKPNKPSFLLFLNCFRASQVGFKQVFDNLTVKNGCFEETDSVSRQLCFEPLFLDLHDAKEILRMIASNDLL